MSIDSSPFYARIPILQKHFVAKVDRASSTLQLWMNSLIEKRNDAGASSRQVYFEDCRKRPRQRNLLGRASAQTQCLNGANRTRKNLERIARYPVGGENGFARYGVVPSLRPINYVTIPAVASFPPEDDRVESLA